MRERDALRPKTYSYLTDYSDEKKKNKHKIISHKTKT